MTWAPDDREVRTMILLVTGGRGFEDFELVWRTLDALNPGRLVVGDASGADAHARAWAANRIMKGAMHKDNAWVFAADWETDGKSAGPRRNQRMLEVGQPNLALAFPGGKGTEDMIRRAKSAGVPVLRVDA